MELEIGYVSPEMTVSQPGSILIIYQKWGKKKIKIKTKTKPKQTKQKKPRNEQKKKNKPKNANTQPPCTKN